MKTYIVWLQKPCGPRANKINHISKVVVCAADADTAKGIASREKFGFPAIDCIEVPPNTSCVLLA